MRFRWTIWLCYFVCGCLCTNFLPAQQLQKPIRILITEEGLPQSFVSAMVQDSTGFIWIATRDGLARYDGKKYKVFRHIPNDSATLSNNIITNLHVANGRQLWIEYETGEVDILNTETETLFHFSKDAAYQNIDAFVYAAEDRNGNTWLLSDKRNLSVCNIEKRTVRHYSETSLGLQNNRIVNILSDKGTITLVTDTGLIRLNENGKLIQTIPYRFTNPHLYTPNWKKGVLFISKENKIVIYDKNRFIIYDENNHSFAEVPLPVENRQEFSFTRDNSGQVIFFIDGFIYKLSSGNTISLLKTKEGNPLYGFKSMMVDRSGVLWMGSNGSGVYLYDLRLPRMTGKSYNRDFHTDVLLNDLNVPEAELEKSFLSTITNPYEFRWMEDRGGRLWFSRAIPEGSAQPQVCFYSNGHLQQPQWHYTDTVAASHHYINVMAESRSGQLWGMDFFTRLLYFDTLTHTVTTYPPLTKKLDVSFYYTVNSLLIEGEDQFWFSTAMNGLFHYDRKRGTIINYLHNNSTGSLPVNQLMNLVRDPSDNNIFWIGSLGGGLIQFNKTTGKCHAFTTQTGLPDNTVYAIIADKRGRLWCSSNKGIFAFDPKTAAVKSFTYKDGLPGDEYNRYHFLQLPDGRLAFGGVNGYAVFNPFSLTNDDFQPQVALTGIKINNKPADYGSPGSPFEGAINSLPQITLDYNNNFLTFEFAALEYNITEKLQYRYRLKGFDDNWVGSGNDNTATYTKIPPGHYVFLINATNTAGRWSEHIKTLNVVVEPPFWETWWAYCLYGAAIAGLIWGYIQYRLSQVRLHGEVVVKEREAAQLKAVDELKSRFFSNITHEFRTPLTLILTPAQRLKSIIQGDTEHRLLSAIERNSHQLLRLINQLLDLSKLESGSLAVHESGGDIVEVINRIVQTFQEEAESKGIGLTVTDELSASRYWFDSDKLEQVAGNLVANALKYTAEGSIRITLFAGNSLDKKEAQQDKKTTGVSITVSDTGIGIPPERLPYIFNRFYQVDDNTLRKLGHIQPHGSGIGLSLVKELVDLQKGSITVDSPGTEPWQTTFTVWLPYRLVNDNDVHFKSSGDAPANNTVSSLPDPALIKNETPEGEEALSVLLVEDNAELAYFIGDSLPPIYKISHAANGKEGLEKAISGMPDLVISDVLMPVMDGYEFCKELKTDERTSHIPVIMLTAKASFDDRIEGLTLGADDYLTKPFHVQELQLRVANLLDRQRRMRDKLRKEISQPDTAKTFPVITEPETVQDAFIKKLYELVEEYLDDTSFSVQELATKIGMSRTSLHTKLKTLTGLPAGDIIRNYRLKRAAQFLKEGFNSSETAYKTGFESPAYFSKCFKDFYRLTPLEFAQQQA